MDPDRARCARLGVGARALLAGSIPTWLSKIDRRDVGPVCGILLLGRRLARDFDGCSIAASHIRQLPPAVLVIVNGFLMAVALATFVGVVVTR